MELVDIMGVVRSLRPALMPEPHIHAEVEVNLVTAGRMTYRFGGTVQALDAGQIAVFWGTVPHRVVELAPATTYVCVYLPMPAFLAIPAGERFRRAVLDGRLLVSPADACDEGQFLRWHRDLAIPDRRRALLVRDELAARLLRIDVEGWRALSLDGEDARARREPLAIAQRMAGYVAEHLDRPLRAAAVARAVGLHPNYAMALFKDCLGTTLGQYVLQQRLARAEALLLATDRDVTEIAFAAGFGSLSRFYEAFRGRFGVTPRELRRRQGH